MSSACTRRYKITIKFWERQIISVPDQFQKFECYILVSIKYESSIFTHLKRALCLNTKDWISHVIRNWQMRSRLEKWPVLCLSYGLLATWMDMAVKCNYWLDPGLGPVFGEEDFNPTWSEDNQHNSVQRLRRDMSGGMRLNMSSRDPLTNWSSFKQSEASQSLPPTLPPSESINIAEKQEFLWSWS